jgi:hypothetical protein
MEFPPDYPLLPRLIEAPLPEYFYEKIKKLFANADLPRQIGALCV